MLTSLANILQQPKFQEPEQGSTAHVPFTENAGLHAVLPMSNGGAPPAIKKEIEELNEKVPKQEDGVYDANDMATDE